MIMRKLTEEEFQEVVRIGFTTIMENQSELAKGIVAVAKGEESGEMNIQIFKPKDQLFKDIHADGDRECESHPSASLVEEQSSSPSRVSGGSTPQIAGASSPDLKTLKDFDPEPCCHGINQRELRIEAVKWYKQLGTEPIEMSAQEFIEGFFNIDVEGGELK